MGTDGGKAWETTLPANTKSFEEVYNSNTEVCPTTLERVIAEVHATPPPRTHARTHEKMTMYSCATSCVGLWGQTHAAVWTQQQDVGAKRARTDV